MATVKDFPWIAHAKECTFGKHAGCVALIKDQAKTYVSFNPTFLGKSLIFDPDERIITKKTMKNVCHLANSFRFIKKQCMLVTNNFKVNSVQLITT